MIISIQQRRPTLIDLTRANSSVAWLTREGRLLARLRLISAFAALGLVVSTLSHPALAAGNNSSGSSAVIELFTSQGCSSCPPADKLLKTYIDRNDVIALSYPVDYWDYLGWQDTFASPMNTQRQREYARQRGDGAVYTPQMVVNGAMHVVGFRQNEIDAAITKAKTMRGPGFEVPLKLHERGGEFVVEAGEAVTNVPAQQMMLWIAAVQSEGTVNVKHGENRGRTLTYYNLVRGITAVGAWDGKPKTISVSKDAVLKPGADKYVVVLQKGSSGPICGASWLTASN